MVSRRHFWKSLFAQVGYNYVHTQVLYGCSVVYVSTFFALTDFISFEEPNLDLFGGEGVQPIYVPVTELCKPITSIVLGGPICIDIINITLLKAIVAIVNFVIY